MSTDLSSLVETIQTGRLPIAFPYTPHPHWPLSPQSPSLSSRPHLRIAILDSSFNPPTIAHAALLRARPLDEHTDFDAHLLLLSVRNADKALKPGDATHAQRAEMMARFAAGVPNCGVGLLDAPMWVDKAVTVRKGLPLDAPTFTLTWLLGLDSLERLFAPRYYASEAAMLASIERFLDPASGENEVVCAWRGFVNGEERQKQIPELAQPFVEQGQIRMIELEGEMGEVSSTELRARRARGDERWRELVPTEITGYVAEKGLYIPEQSKDTK